MRAVLVGITLILVTLGLMGCGGSAGASVKAELRTEQAIMITGAGSVYPALQALADAYTAQTRGVRVVFLPNSQSTGGIVGVRDGLADIGAMTRALKPEENDGRLTYRELARDALMVAVHSKVTGVTNLTTADLRAIYSGKVSNWRELGGPDAAIVVLDRPEDESAKILLRQSYLGKDLAISPAAIILQQEEELAKTMLDTPYSIGAFSLAYAISGRLSVTHLSLDGTAPTPDSVRAGQYTMVRTLSVLWRSDPSPAAGQFLDFAFAQAGAAELVKAGYVPSAKDK